jgi:hypothetical protein
MFEVLRKIRGLQPKAFCQALLEILVFRGARFQKRYAGVGL